MNRIFGLAIAALLLSACSVSSTAEVSVEPKLNATLGDDLKILARAQGEADMTCRVFEAPYEAGRFQLTGLCKDTSYTLTLTNPSLLVRGDTTLLATGKPMTASLELWPAPAGDGISMLSSGGGLETVGQYTDVKTVHTDDEARIAVRYPRHKPNGTHHVDDGSFLVLAGQALISRLEVLPLVESTEERGFEGYTLGPHWFAGQRFTSDTEYEAVTAEINSAGITNVLSSDGRAVRYIAHDALPAGHYAMLGEDDRRMYVISFGPKATEAAASN
ncbi:MAG: hypothetical protein ACI8S6_002104 [Myxococcota bacterium]|jgi:hypothetical protein